MQNFCFCQLSMQILWRRRCSRVVDLKLPIMREEDDEESLEEPAVTFETPFSIYL